MFQETVDARHWLLMPIPLCIGLVVLIMTLSSSGSGRRCCKRKSRQCADVHGVVEEKRSSQDDLPKADESHNLDDNDDVMLAILKPLRNLSECHTRPYLFEGSPIKPTGRRKQRGDTDRERNIVNILSEQVHSSFPVGFGESVLNPGCPNGTDNALPIHGDKSFVPEDQIQGICQNVFTLQPHSDHVHRTTSPGTHQDVLAKRSGQCGDFNNNEMPYTVLTPLAGNIRVSYTSLKIRETDSYLSATSNSLTESATGGLCVYNNMLQNSNAYNSTLPDSNAYNNTLPDTNAYNNALPDSDAYSDTLLLSGDCVARPTVAIWHDGLGSCDRRSGLNSGHYSSLGPHDYETAMSGIYDTIQDIKYLTVCTTSPASTKDQRELQEQNKVSLEAAKRKTIASFGEIELKTSSNEVY